MKIKLIAKQMCHLGTKFYPIFDWLKNLGIRDLLVKKLPISICNRPRISRFCTQFVPNWTKSDFEVIHNSLRCCK